MEMYATIVYVISDDVLRILNVKDDPQSKMSNAEVMTFAIITAKFFSGNYKLSRYLCMKLGLFPDILSNSRLNRRIHNIVWPYWYAIFRFLSFLSLHKDDTCYFAVDSFPVSCCQKNRIDKRKLFLERKYLGFAASKKRYFCGIKVHMVVTNQGRPIEVHFKPGAESDVNVLWTMELDIPPHSMLYADGAYNCFDLEDILQDEKINLLAKRGPQAKNRARTPIEERKISSKRQMIETAFSCITSLFPRFIKSRTENGFLIKVFCFVLAYSASFLWEGSLT
jgi:Transposase DDE domain